MSANVQRKKKRRIRRRNEMLFKRVFKNLREKKKWFCFQAEMITAIARAALFLYFALTMILCKSLISCNIFYIWCGGALVKKKNIYICGTTVIE